MKANLTTLLGAALLLPSLCLAQEEVEDPVAALAKICAEVRCYPAGTLRIVMEDGTTREFTTEFTLPIVHNGYVAIHPGITLFLAGEIVDGKVVNLRAVDEPATPVNVIKFQMYQEEGEPATFLIVTNYFPELIKYRADMMLPTSDDIRGTSSCAVLSNGRSVYEQWPHPIFQLLLFDFHVLETKDGEIPCVY